MFKFVLMNTLLLAVNVTEDDTVYSVTQFTTILTVEVSALPRTEALKNR